MRLMVRCQSLNSHSMQETWGRNRYRDWNTPKGWTVVAVWLGYRQGREVFSFPEHPDRLWGPFGGGVHLSVVKRVGCESDFSLPATVEVKDERSYTSITPHAFMACTLITLPLLSTFYPNNLGKSSPLECWCRWCPSRRCGAWGEFQRAPVCSASCS